MLFEATDPEKNKKPKCVSLIPVSYIGKTVVRSGFSPVIRSGGEPMIVTSGLEPVIQTGFPLANQSGEELKAFGSNGYPISRSGV